MSPVDALELLLPVYADTLVRSRAVEWISEMSDDDFFDFLPQLIQALKFESYHTSALAKLIAEKSIQNPRIAHQTYWYEHTTFNPYQLNLDTCAIHVHVMPFRLGC